MAIVGFIRVNSLAEVLGLGRATVRRWLDRAGYRVTQIPAVVPKGFTQRTGGKTGPLYITMAEALEALDALIPASISFAQHESIRGSLWRAHRKVRESTTHCAHRWPDGRVG